MIDSSLGYARTKFEHGSLPDFHGIAQVGYKRSN